MLPAASTGHFERSSEVRNVGRCIVFEQPDRLGGDERPASSGVEGASSGAEEARAAISNAPAIPSCRKRWQVLCFRGQTEPSERVN